MILENEEKALKLGDLSSFQIVNLLEMIRITRDALKLLDTIHLLSKRIELSSRSEDAVMIESQIRNAKKDLEPIYSLVGEMKLRESIKKLQRIQQGINGGDYTFRKYSDDLAVLQELVTSELESVYFGYIPIDKSAYFVHPLPFGANVSGRFPSTRTDIDAGRICFAHGLYTAAVFHMMRVVEIGARALIKGLKAQKYLPYQLELCTWGQLHIAMQEGLKVLRVNHKSTIARKDRYEYFNEAAASFRYFGDAWRNSVSHTRKEYDEGVAKDIIEHTRQFMDKLSERLMDDLARQYIREKR
jgi:hypothetical protein